MQWFQKFMMGRYGADPLNLAIILLSLVISIAFSFTPVAWIGSILCTILLADLGHLPHVFAEHGQARGGKSRLYEVLESRQKLVPVSLALGALLQKEPLFSLPALRTHRLRAARHGQGDHHLQKLPHKIRQKGIRPSFRRGGARG